jgi:hypothetical protein
MCVILYLYYWVLFTLRAYMGNRDEEDKLWKSASRYADGDEKPYLYLQVILAQASQSYNKFLYVE